MNRNRTLTAALVAATLSLGLAAPAFAGDPVVSTDMGYLPTDGTLGTTFDINASGCAAAGGDTYFGGYLDGEGVPFTDSGELTTGGSWTRHIEIGADADLGAYTVHAYCAKGPVSSPTDDNMLWVSAPYAFTIWATDSSPNATKQSNATRLLSSLPDQALTVDPEALPVVDRMGIGGTAAAALKERVDAHVTTVGQVSRLYRAFFGRSASSSDLKYWSARLDRHSTPTTIARQFAASSEFKRDHGKLSDAAYVDAISQNALGHPAAAATRATLVSQLRRHHTTRALVALTIANSPESMDLSDDASYVITAYEVLAHRAPRAAEITAQTELLQTTLTPRVQVVENIAEAAGR